MAIKKDKYLNALLFFVANCGNEKLGITKLNKLFYYLDFISYRDCGKSVTGETYIRLPMGPLASHLKDKIIPFAKENDLIKQSQVDSQKFGKRNSYKANADFDPSIFNDYEKKLLSYLCQTFRDWNTDEMIAQTHSEAPWVFSDPNKPIDYKNADDIEFFRENRTVV